MLTKPERRQVFSNATLAMFASETRDVAGLIANELGLKIPDLAQLDAAITEQLDLIAGSDDAD